MCENLTIEERAEYFTEYLGVRLDIICNNPGRWLDTAYYQLPTFEYYLNNVIYDKGGKYDFTQRLYNSYATSTDIIHDDRKWGLKMLGQKTAYKYIKSSCWMGTEFNFKECIEIKERNDKNLIAEEG